MSLYWGWVVCFCVLLLSTIAIGILFSFVEVMIPVSSEFPGNLALLGKLANSLVKMGNLVSKPKISIF